MLSRKENIPIQLCSTRAWRTYLGGKLLDEIYGQVNSEDGHFPEEWIASLVEARNAGREHIKEEGLSHLAVEPERTLKALLEEEPEKYLGRERWMQLGTSMGVLVKLIDSAERLTIQVHPDREKARTLFHSEYGKTECWYILGGREAEGEEPCIYLGFRPGITRQHWEELFYKQDIEGLINCLHRFPVKAGNTILVEGGIPHAIGAGCFLVEIQEPTDYTIRVERTTASGFQVDDALCHQGLGFEKMFDCFHYEGLSEGEIRKRWFIEPQTEDIVAGGRVTTVIGYESTPYFKMKLIELTDTVTLMQEMNCSAMYVLDGEGRMYHGSGMVSIERGNQFFIPHETCNLTWSPAKGSTLRMIQCYGPADR